ncbi:MAG: aldehyde dehydrogenase family protein [Burkholderiales bacterium]
MRRGPSIHPTPWERASRHVVDSSTQRGGDSPAQVEWRPMNEVMQSIARCSSAIRGPAPGDYELRVHDASDVSATAARVASGQAVWADAGVAHRRAVLAAFRDALSAARPSWWPRSKPTRGGVGPRTWKWIPCCRTSTRCSRYATGIFDARSSVATADPGVRFADLEPCRLVGCISPWNFPLQLALIDAVPALLAGSSVVVKPSEMTPRFVPVLRSILAKTSALDQVLAIVEGDAVTGAALVAVADAICFTGSTATGRRIAQTAAERLVPAFLELGGKDPAIVLQSADLDAASSAIIWGSTINSGHSCMSIERVYVDEEIFEPFVERLVRKANAARLAYPSVGDGEIGPIITEQQIAVIEAQLRDAVERGATIRTGGEMELLGGGTYLRPTVLTDVDHSMRIMQEETFGPIVPLMPFATSADAVSLANDGQYGLSAAVFAATVDEALEVAHQLEAGGVSINDVCLTGLVPEAEKNSFKLSGLGGSRMGPSSVRRFLRQRAIISRDRAGPRPWYYDAAGA